MNVLHWHLTEDQMAVAHRSVPQTHGGGRLPNRGRRHGPWRRLTKQDIADIVAHAAERHDGRAEVELPGHSRAALPLTLAGCTGDTLPVPHWGVFKDVVLAGNDSTMAFLKAVLDETCEMFPSEVIHIGGDEVPKVRWAEWRVPGQNGGIGPPDRSRASNPLHQ